MHVYYALALSTDIRDVLSTPFLIHLSLLLLLLLLLLVSLWHSQVLQRIALLPLKEGRPLNSDLLAAGKRVRAEHGEGVWSKDVAKAFGQLLQLGNQR